MGSGRDGQQGFASQMAVKVRFETVVDSGRGEQRGFTSIVSAVKVCPVAVVDRGRRGQQGRKIVSSTVRICLVIVVDGKGAAAGAGLHANCFFCLGPPCIYCGGLFGRTFGAKPTPGNWLPAEMANAKVLDSPGQSVERGEPWRSMLSLPARFRRTRNSARYIVLVIYCIVLPTSLRNPLTTATCIPYKLIQVVVPIGVG